MEVERGINKLYLRISGLLGPLYLSPKLKNEASDLSCLYRSALEKSQVAPEPEVLSLDTPLLWQMII